MPEVNPLKIKTFSTPKQLCQWLSFNHASETELWVKIFKKNTVIQSVTWNELVIEVLCWGWIDGLKKSLDDSAYLQRITPRKARSGWSKRNTQHVERLISEGRMQESGLKQVQAAKADGRWESAYVVSEMQVPLDFVEALNNQLQAKQFYQSLSKSSRYVIAHGLLSAKKPETRQKRFTKYLDMLVNQQKPK
ncbi:YdeI/OmpD-associated family protein [Paraglaciecola sp.]|uniref:YdeI/OmpD-associated family protein n=1 Tax=Paraglaciecola sp. TaxID=1920173 RepID=UPI003EF9F506